MTSGANCHLNPPPIFCTDRESAPIEYLCYSPPVLRVSYFRARIDRSLADALNQESGQVYTDALVRHWRVYIGTSIINLDAVGALPLRRK
jgi:hypothetical protein